MYFTQMGTPISGFDIVCCTHCQKYAIWLSGKIIYPASGSAPLPHPDLPRGLKEDYEEAKNVVSSSPRSAAALLRLVIEQLTNHILQEAKGKDLNENIGILVKRNMSKQIQESLDVLRVIGNNSVHLGQLDMKDDIHTALALFGLVNIITEAMIAEPRKIKSLFDSLPEGAKKGIERRDKANSSNFKK